VGFRRLLAQNFSFLNRNFSTMHNLKWDWHEVAIFRPTAAKIIQVLKISILPTKFLQNGRFSVRNFAFLGQNVRTRKKCFDKTNFGGAIEGNFALPSYYEAYRGAATLASLTPGRSLASRSSRSSVEARTERRNWTELNSTELAHWSVQFSSATSFCTLLYSVA